MRKAMEKLMGVKKDGGQEVLITLGLVALGVALLVVFWDGGSTTVRTMVTNAGIELNKLFTAKP